MGNEKLSEKLTFYKAFFSPQWKFLIHTILQCLSAKTTAWNKFSSTMASAIICLATNQKFNFSKYIFDSMVKNVENVNKFLMYPRFVQVFVNQQVSDMSNHKRIYVTPSHTKKVFGNMKREGKGFSERVTPLFSTTMVQAQEEMGKGLAMPTDPHRTPIITQPTTSQPQKKQKPRKPKRNDTEAPRPSGPITNVADGDLTKENVSKYSNDPLLSGEERYMAEKEVSTGNPATTAGEVVTTGNVEVSTTSPTAATITTVELTLAQTLAELKSARPKTKGVVMQEPSESITTTTTIPSNDKGKGIMVEEPLKTKKKDKISFDEQEDIRLQAEFDKEVRLAREKDEANVALIEEWNDIQAKIEADQLLAESQQAKEQEELTIEERAKLF
ncbi:hypothetical protein Tco_1502009 [Tanacetum coccineum]